jgi:hypothetical protein
MLNDQQLGIYYRQAIHQYLESQGWERPEQKMFVYKWDTQEFLEWNYENIPQPTIEQLKNVSMGQIQRIKRKVKKNPKIELLTTPERDELSPQQGEMIFNTDENKIQVYVGGVWF